MALKDFIVYLGQGERASVRLRLAADLASRHGSRLTALYVREMSPAQLHAQTSSELGLQSFSSVRRAHADVDRVIGDTAERLRAELDALAHRLHLETEWRCLDGCGADLVPQLARSSDLCIVSQDIAAVNDAIEYTFSEKLLFTSGRPVIFVPAQGPFETLGRHVAVAWNFSRPAARAINDALALIERADRVSVLSINPQDYATRGAMLGPQSMVEHLRRHGAAVESMCLTDVPRERIASTLQAEACRLGADLLVSGAFGHPKLWEKLLGGVTRDLLRDMRLPTLMSY
jgi:nucleotide-binding universal stress UspA family protein